MVMSKNTYRLNKPKLPKHLHAYKAHTHGMLQHSATSQHRVSRAIETRVKHDEIIAESKLGRNRKCVKRCGKRQQKIKTKRTQHTHTHTRCL